MNLGIDGRVALVTGAGRGLGEGICRSLAGEGAKIIACSRTAADLRALVEELGGEIAGHRWIDIDLSTEDGPSKLIDYVHISGLTPTILVNNVGGSLDSADPLGPLAEWRRVMRLNVEVPIELNRAFVPAMRASRWGRICHVSSIAALENQGSPAYCSSKAALNAYVRSVGRFVAADNVIMTSVMPGVVVTAGGYWEAAQQNRPEHVAKFLTERMAIRRFGRVDEISGVVAFLCSEHASFCVGSCILADGGQGRVFPALNE
jgi:NAD(P)-dependent dehydrogenase (short-subunit alcohol dehydrogenase family)